MIIERVGDLMEALLRFDPHDRLDFEVKTYDEDGQVDDAEGAFLRIDRNRHGHVCITLDAR